ncbi:pilus assembly protein CpaC [Palleronia aestuarii]|uniref:Pilus assembly protein CpaC n=1 Tax=Palleronia aestuarii TaxID=568105 RepID=A0A2W7MZW4_9RHOB|nr:type II and III secretion system protein family protein [Palleronia aestuarii]PZX13123.1 pilus assembly protein CpaC [Palleronia aestuarii]
MRLLARATLLFVLALAAPWPGGNRATGQEALRLSNLQAEKIAVPVGESRVFSTGRDISQLVIGNPEVADVVLVSPRSFYVLGQGLGQTNLQVFADGEYPIGLVDLEVTVDTGDLSSALRNAAPAADIRAQSVNGRLRLQGTVPDAPTLDRVLEIAGQYGSEEVINGLQVTSPQQVFLEVRIIEASRDAGKSLGINVDVFDQGSEGFTSLNSGRRLNGDDIPFGSFLATLVRGGLNVDLLIDTLEERGLARSLAEPTLAALSGETASFLAGGEIPIPVAEEDGRVTIVFKEFGVRLSFTPVVLDNGLINLELEPEVSQVDFSNTFDTGLIELPSFSTRRANTTIELADGQSFAIAGLLQRNNTRRQRQVPWLGDVPVLGALFRSASYQKDETDLVILVTPRLSRPAASPSLLATPLDYSTVTRESTYFLYGIQEISRGEMTRQLEQRGIEAPFGHVIDDDYIPGLKYAGK